MLCSPRSCATSLRHKPASSQPEIRGAWCRLARVCVALRSERVSCTPWICWTGHTRG